MNGNIKKKINSSIDGKNIDILRVLSEIYEMVGEYEHIIYFIRYFFFFFLIFISRVSQMQYSRLIFLEINSGSTIKKKPYCISGTMKSLLFFI